MKKLIFTVFLSVLAMLTIAQNNILVIDYNNSFSSDQRNNNSIIYNRLLATQTSVTRVAAIPAAINPATYNQVWIFGDMGAPVAGNLNPVATYMNNGGAVYVQSEVSCCNNQGAYVDALINQTVTAGGSITHSTTYGGYYEVNYTTGCTTAQTYGAACRPFPGTPAANIFMQATATCGGTMTGRIAAVKFRNCDMISGNGALVSIGDFNVFPSAGACGTVGILGTANRNGLIDHIAGLLPSLLTCQTTTTPTFDIRDTIVCGTPVSYVSPLQDTSYNYLWSNGATADSTTYNSQGKHWLRIEISPGCYITDTFNITYNGSLTVSVNDTAVCAGQSATLTATPGAAGGTYSWSPGGQTTQSISVTPGATTNYIVTYTNTGCTGIDTGTVTVNAIPNTDFTFDTVCVGYQTCFIDLSTVTNSTVTGWQWIFGDGSPTDTTANPCHTYGAAGTYIVTLIARSAEGCTGTKTDTVTVTSVPTADFSTGNVCQNTAAQFTDLSTIPTDSIVQWQWDFGDGPGTSSQQNPSYQYPTPGTYTVTLIALPASGIQCSDTATKQITIHPMPNADFNFTDVCMGDSNVFSDLSTVATGAITNWQWDFGDNQTGNAQNPTHGYGQEGSYTVELTVTTDSGCVDTVSKQVSVFGVPNVDFDRNSVCEGNLTQLNDRSSINFGTYQSWAWDFGDGSANGSGQNVSHLYGAPSTYQVKLVVTTTDGCIDSITKPVWVNPEPVVDFVADTLEGCAPICPQFTNQTTVASGNIATYNWDFGDGGSSGSVSPSHCYDNSGLTSRTYDIQLTATSDSGCVASTTKGSYISVYPYPIADFSANPDLVKISNPIIEFSNLSRGESSWTWDFGDGTTNTSLANPTHQYTDTGKFVTWLHVENQWGCRDSTFLMVEVEPEFFVYIPNSFSPGVRDGINDYWYPKAYGVVEMEMFIFDRWGEKIWSGTMGEKWDGMYQGERAETEVYVYLVKVKTVLNTDVEYRGKVTLLK